VAVQTVYAVFGTKRSILAELLEVRTVGDEQEAPLRDRQDWQAMEGETDPRKQVALLAAIATRIGTRIAALTEVMAAAAGSDPGIAAMYRQRQQARYEDQRALTQSLSRKGALRPGLSQAHATDIIWTLANPRNHHALVSERHWTTDEYQHWLAHQLAFALLAEP
jgi:TetR/AcrR family transcriptional regulator, regulator of autoinduction and epiphytic fitness